MYPVFSRSLLQGGTKEKNNSLRRGGVASGFLGWEKLLMFVCGGG